MSFSIQDSPYSERLSSYFHSVQTRLFVKNRVAAIMGSPSKVVKHSSGKVYITLLYSGRTMVVANKEVSISKPGLRVWVGPDADTSGGPLQVLGERAVFSTPVNTGVSNHAEDHQWLGPDTVWVHPNQYLPLLALKGNTAFSIEIRGYTLSGWLDPSSFVEVRTQTLDLASHVPSNGARFCLIQLDSTGILSVVDGSVMEDPDQLLISTHIPAPSADQKGVWAVKLYTGQDRIHHDPMMDDLVDLRMSLGGGGGGASGVEQSGSVVAGNLAQWAADNTIEDTGIVAADVITSPESVVSALTTYGPNLLVNPDFATDASGWNVGDGWAWEDDGAGGGQMRHTTGYTAMLTQDGELIGGVVYSYSLIIGGTAGYIVIMADDGDQFVMYATELANTNYLMYAVDSGVKIKIIPSTDFDGFVKNIYVRRPPVVQEPKVVGNLVYGRRDGSWFGIVNSYSNVITLYYGDSMYVATLADCTIAWNASGGDCVQMLPPATGSGKIYYFKKADSSANTVTVTPDGSETINGAADFVLTAQHETLAVQDFSTAVWIILSHYTP